MALPFVGRDHHASCVDSAMRFDLLPPITGGASRHPSSSKRQLYLEAHGISAAVAAAVDTTVAETSEEPLARIAELLLSGGGLRQLTDRVLRQDKQLDFLLQARATLEKQVSDARQQILSLRETERKRFAIESDFVQLRAELSALADHARALSIRNKGLVLQQKEAHQQLELERAIRLRLLELLGAGEPALTIGEQSAALARAARPAEADEAVVEAEVVPAGAESIAAVKAAAAAAVAAAVRQTETMRLQQQRQSQPQPPPQPAPLVASIMRRVEAPLETRVLELLPGAAERAGGVSMQLVARRTTLEFDATRPIGLSMMADTGGQWVVTDVVPGSEAEQMGVQLGSVLETINGRTVAGLDQTEATSLIVALPGDRVVGDGRLMLTFARLVLTRAAAEEEPHAALVLRRAVGAGGVGPATEAPSLRTPAAAANKQADPERMALDEHRRVESAAAEEAHWRINPAAQAVTTAATTAATKAKALAEAAPPPPQERRTSGASSSGGQPSVESTRGSIRESVAMGALRRTAFKFDAGSPVGLSVMANANVRANALPCCPPPR